MSTLIIYDSAYGNTAKVANAIARSIESTDSVMVKAADEVGLNDIGAADTVIVGSPTQGGQPTAKIKQFLNSLAPDSLRGKEVAAFDTRFAVRAQKFLLRLLMRLIGYAAPRIAASLRDKGGTLLTGPEGFIVQDKTGPLAPGELNRAKLWITLAKEVPHEAAQPTT